jgi:hypothetical protein
MRFGEPDRVFFMPQWVWGATIKCWHAEGLTRDAHADEFFGYDRYVRADSDRCRVTQSEMCALQSGTGGGFYSRISRLLVHMEKTDDPIRQDPIASPMHNPANELLCDTRVFTSELS